MSPRRPTSAISSPRLCGGLHDDDADQIDLVIEWLSVVRDGLRGMKRDERQEASKRRRGEPVVIKWDPLDATHWFIYDLPRLSGWAERIENLDDLDGDTALTYYADIADSLGEINRVAQMILDRAKAEHPEFAEGNGGAKRD